jgi:transglutaminase-like putative cysteine protease
MKKQERGIKMKKVTVTRCKNGIIFSKKKPASKVFPLVLIFILSFFLGIPTKTKGSVCFELKPRELRIIEITDQGKLIDTMKQKNNFTPLIHKALNSVPSWIKSDLQKQFKELTNRPIMPLAGSTPSTGDVNHDGLLDLVIGSSKGYLRIFLNQGIQQKSSLSFDNQIDFLQWKNCEINPALFDLNGDGFADLVIGVKNQLFILFNKKQTNHITFSEPTLWYTEPLSSPDQEENLTPCAVDIDSTLAIILGHKDGSLTLFKKEHGMWINKPDYFNKWKPTKNTTPTVFPTNQNGYILVVGNQKGKLDTFSIQLDLQNLRIMKPLHLLDLIETQGDTSPAFYDVDNNGRMDIIFCSNEEPASYLLNKGTNAMIDFQILDSQAEKNMTISIFGGASYNRDFDPLYASSFNNELSEKVAQFILAVEPKYRDEVAYCIANLQVQDIVAYVNSNVLYLLEENVKDIYKISSQVSYVKMKELKEFETTTLSYNTSTGWKDMPTETYYQYLVMLNRFLLVPNHFESMYNNNFFRSFLPYDKTYGITLFERVKGAATLYEAAYEVMYWLKEDIGGVWSTGKKPPGWYYIYKNLTNPDAGLWCGEWAVIYEACARAMNIPTISVASLGEDHQFNNFWADSWHHLDASAGEATVKNAWKPFFDNSLIYYTTWGNRLLSWPMENEENGKYNHVWRSELFYNPEDLLSDFTFIVKDKEGVPIDGARVELWSHWSMENRNQSKPFITAFGFTNSDGETTIKKVGPQNFTVIVVSRIGSFEFQVSLKKPGNRTFPITIDEKIPSVYPFDTLKKANPKKISTVERTYQIHLSDFIQANLPISNIYTTILQYVSFWKQDKGRAEVYLLSETELAKLKAGLPLGIGEERKLDGLNQVHFDIPDNKTNKEKYYLVFWNPNFATQMKVKVN